jgi:molybdopterin synthase catalytic subunit
MTWSAIVDHPLDVGALVARVQTPGTGALSVFIGAVRDVNDGRPVTGIEYVAYRAMAERELAAILAEGERSNPGLRLAAEHRVGALAVGDASVVIVASDAHRARVHAATSRVIEEIKRRVPIWKCEHYADGTREWAHAGSGGLAAAAPAGPVGEAGP